MKNPLVYIILPVYNCENYFLEQLMSIYYQNYTDWYLIIVNDWSTDDSGIIANNFIKNYNLHDKVKIIKKENWWLNSAIQKWLEEVKKLCDIFNTNSLISYCDSDDIWTRDKLSFQVSFMLKHPEYWMTYHNMVGIDDDSNVIKSSYLNNDYHIETFIYISTIWNQYTWPTLMFKAKYIDYILPMPLHRWSAQDYWTALVLSLLDIKIQYFNKKLVYHRIRRWSLQREYEKKTQNDKNNIRIAYYSFLQKRFPNKNLSYIVQYNYDRFINRNNKWYWKVRIYLMMLFKYPDIFFIWFKSVLGKLLKIKTSKLS
jgi:glycosyltransferase involved in cell wall biosynthesis